MRIIPSSYGADDVAESPSRVFLREYNKCHHPGGKAEGGQFCSTSGTASAKGEAPSKGKSPAATSQVDYKKPGQVAKKVADIDEAIRLIQEGQLVELESTAAVVTLLEKLGKIAQEMTAKAQKGEKPPNYDLCKVSVAGTNLFCGSRVRTPEHPEGISRIKMPQLSGEAVPGSPAAKLAPDPFNPGKVNGAEAFQDHLFKLGFKITKGSEVASSLKATQSELIGVTVAGMMLNEEFDPGAEPIFVSSDNYVLDGHHRWAAVVGRDLADGTLGDLKMNVVKVDAPISQLLHLATTWSEQFGIRAKGVK